MKTSGEGGGRVPIDIFLHGVPRISRRHCYQSLPVNLYHFLTLPKCLKLFGLKFI